MGLRETLFGGRDEIKFKEIPQSAEATRARERLSEISEGPLPEIPLLKIAPLQPISKERTLARETATKLAQPTESQDIFSFPEVQAIIAEAKEAGDILANRLGRGIQKVGAGSSTTGRDLLGRSVSEVERGITAALAPFAESQRTRAFAEKGRIQNLIPLLESLGLTEEDRPRGIEQAEFAAQFGKESLESQQLQDFLIPLLQSIIGLQPGQASFIREPKPGLIEQIGLISSIIPKKKGTE